MKSAEAAYRDALAQLADRSTIETVGKALGFIGEGLDIMGLLDGRLVTVGDAAKALNAACEQIELSRLIFAGEPMRSSDAWREPISAALHALADAVYMRPPEPKGSPATAPRTAPAPRISSDDQSGRFGLLEVDL